MSQETLVFNIGGSVFETNRSTLLKLPHISPLVNNEIMADHHREEKDDYFFDRDPDMFKAILNYLRTEELHIPSNICAPAAMAELKFWGIPAHMIAACCSSKLNDWSSITETMITLDQDRNGSIQKDVDYLQQTTWYSRYQPRIWNFLSNSSTSKAALVFGCISYFIVLLYIASIVVPSFIRDFISNNADYSVIYSVNYTAFGAIVEDNPKTLEVLRLTTACSYVYLGCIVLFILEYVVRFFFAPAKCRFLIMPLNLLEVLALILDTSNIFVSEFGFIPITIPIPIQMFRILRFFRLIKHTSGPWVFVYTLKASVMNFVYFIWSMFICQLLFAIFLYELESSVHVVTFPDALWWAIITMTTVGYGDIYPVTWLGKCIASLCAVTGIVIIIFFLSGISRNYSYWHKRVNRALEADMITKRNSSRVTPI